MGKGIVVELQAEALNEKIDIETLMRKAHLVAKKLHLTAFDEWILSEQNGYKSTDVPDYRNVGGEIKAWNPYHGWVPVIMDGKLGSLLETMPLCQPIAGISEAYNSGEPGISLTVSQELTDFLNSNSGMIPTKYQFKTSRTEFRKVISAVRNQILDWAILLQENGIVGEDLSFTETEIKTAVESKTITNYTNNFYSSAEGTTIQQGSSEADK